MSISYGLIADIVECLIQRCFAYNTRDIRVTIDSVKAWLADDEVSRVVLIGHSQGGIIISLVLDYLFADLPAAYISKLVNPHLCQPITLYSKHFSCNQLFFRMVSRTLTWCHTIEGNLHLCLRCLPLQQSSFPLSWRPTLHRTHRTLLQRIRHGRAVGRAPQYEDGSR